MGCKSGCGYRGWPPLRSSAGCSRRKLAVEKETFANVLTFARNGRRLTRRLRRSAIRQTSNYPSFRDKKEVAHRASDSQFAGGSACDADSSTRGALERSWDDEIR